MKMNSLLGKILFLVLIGLFFVSLSAPQNISDVNAADGTAGEIEVMTSSLIDGQTATFRCYDLTAEGDYTLDFSTGSADQHNFTAPADGGDYYYTTIIEEPTAGGACTITLESQSDGTALYTVYVNFVAIDTLIPTALLVGVAIALMVVGILVGIAASVARKKR